MTAENPERAIQSDFHIDPGHVKIALQHPRQKRGHTVRCRRVAERALNP